MPASGPRQVTGARRDGSGSNEACGRWSTGCPDYHHSNVNPAHPAEALGLDNRGGARMAVMSATMPLAMTAEQHRSFEERGFILIENFFEQAELARLLAAIDEVGDRVRAEKGLTERDPFALRNALAHHDAF